MERWYSKNNIWRKDGKIPGVHRTTGKSERQRNYKSYTLIYYWYVIRLGWTSLKISWIRKCERIWRFGVVIVPAFDIYTLFPKIQYLPLRRIRWIFFNRLHMPMRCTNLAASRKPSVCILNAWEILTSIHVHRNVSRSLWTKGINSTISDTESFHGIKLASHLLL